MPQPSSAAGVPDVRLIDFGNLWVGDIATALFVGVVVALSVLTWRCIERPGQALFARLLETGARLSAQAASFLRIAAPISSVPIDLPPCAISPVRRPSSSTEAIAASTRSASATMPNE